MSPLSQFLEEFVDRHRGVRPGKMFGRPCVYVGRRLCARLDDRGIVVRLPGELARREVREHGMASGQRGRGARSWVVYRPRTPPEFRHLVRMLEIAVRDAAEGVTGVAAGASVRQRDR